MWIDLPPSAVAPVYKEKVYVKALRMPKHIELNFKNDEIYMKKKAKKAQQAQPQPNLLNDNLNNNKKDLRNFNSSNSNENGNANSYSNVNLNTNEKKFNSGNNISNSSNVPKNDLGFAFGNGIFKIFLFSFFFN